MKILNLISIFIFIIKLSSNNGKQAIQITGSTSY